LKQLQSPLLESDEIGLAEGAHDPSGSYNPMRFVLRLRKDIHTALATVEPGINLLGSNSEEQQQAFSTYLHETIHWWQYVGSNFGFISSLCFPSQSHRIWPDLREIINSFGCVKSIEILHEKQLAANETNHPSVNRAVNYWIDLEGGLRVSFDPQAFQYFLENPHYVSVGHSAYILYSSAIHCLASVVDQNLEFLPRADQWTQNFVRLRDEKAMWYDPEPTEIVLSPLGTKAIFEGQARMSQLQYLYFSSGGEREFEEFKQAGLLEGVYVEALNHFLVVLDKKLPATPHDPLIGLFLLICDIAVNPTDGFPFEIEHFPSFYVSVDPGIRFHMLCGIVRDKYPFLETAIVAYSKKEYVDLSMILCYELRCRSPYDSAEEICKWRGLHPSITELMQEEKQFKYQDTNMPVRLFLSKFIRFSEDKYEHPQLFCWPGASFVGLATNQLDLNEALKIFNRQTALFVDNIDGNVYATVQEGVSEAQLDETLNNFFSWNCIYEMVRQWIIEPGPFTYDLKWLSNKYTQAEGKNWVCNSFVKVFGHHPDTFKVL